MAAIRTIDSSNLTIAKGALGLSRDGSRGTVRQMVHDGDTINVQPIGNLGVRFLGIDTPEVSFRIGEKGPFRPLSHPQWEELLTDPFAEKWPAFQQELPRGLREFLRPKYGKGTAATHHKHALSAEDALESLIEKDIEVMRQDAESFRFFMAFGFEVMDGYGRLLCYINREQPDRNRPAPRPRTYNERLLELGRAFPYFIWPNVNPFKKADSVVDAVLKPGTQRTIAEADRTLNHARTSVEAARQKHLGLFDAMSPCQLEPFELRFLSRRTLPSRWLIDLTKNDDVLIRPENYHQVPHSEDRLWISPQFLPLFVEHGWKRQKRGS